MRYDPLDARRALTCPDTLHGRRRRCAEVDRLNVCDPRTRAAHGTVPRRRSATCGCAAPRAWTRYAGRGRPARGRRRPRDRRARERFDVATRARARPPDRAAHGARRARATSCAAGGAAASRSSSPRRRSTVRVDGQPAGRVRFRPRPGWDELVHPRPAARITGRARASSCGPLRLLPVLVLPVDAPFRACPGQRVRRLRACADRPRPGERRRAGARLLRGASARASRGRRGRAGLLPRLPGARPARADPRRAARPRRRLRRGRLLAALQPSPRRRDRPVARRGRGRAHGASAPPALASSQGDGADPARPGQGRAARSTSCSWSTSSRTLADVQAALEASAPVCHQRTRRLHLQLQPRSGSRRCAPRRCSASSTRPPAGGLAAAGGGAQHAPARGLRGRPARRPGRLARSTCRSCPTSSTATWATCPGVEWLSLMYGIVARPSPHRFRARPRPRRSA